MAAATFRSDERIGLMVALAAHAGLVTWLALWKPSAEPVVLPDTVSVTFNDEVGLTATAPDRSSDPAPDAGPVLGDAPPPPAPLEAPPVTRLALQPRLRVVTPPPRPVATARPRRDPIGDLIDRQPPRARPTSGPRRPPSAPPRGPTGGGSSRVDEAFKGFSGGSGTGAPPAAIGPAQRASLAGAIARELKPKWVAPQGADAEKLITILSWDLNPDGTLAGTPRVVRQEGITDANRAQAQRHAEQAIRAVRLAAPFDLPDALYPAWKRIANFRFDRRLSQ